MRWTTCAANARLITALLTCALSLTACNSSGSDPTTAAAQNANAASSTLSLSSEAYSVGQTAGSVSLVVARTGDTSVAVSVKYASANQTAVAGSDYTSVSGTLSWTAGDATSKTITVPVNSATAFSGTKTFTVALSEPSSSALVSPPASATVNIAGAAGGSTTVGNLQFSTASYSVQQSDGELMVAVNRMGGSAGAISVAYSTSDGSAAAGADYTEANGQLDWVDGDSAVKTFPIEINTAAGFSGTKSFTVALATPSGGAKLANPSSATVTITGAGSSGQPPSNGTGAPSAVGNLQLINQGGSSNDTNPATNIQQISWTAATSGANPISYYRIYRNGTAYATTTSLTYTDKNATNSLDPAWGKASTIYSYNVTAVDTAGVEGPKASQMSVYAYRNGVSNWSKNDLSYGTIVENYTSTAGTPKNGAYDISVNFISGGFQPAVHPPQAPLWNLEIGAFNYYTIDVNPGPSVNTTRLTLGTVTRLPPGDVYGWHPEVNVYDYGPAPVANTWATYKVPLVAVAMGVCDFTGSISGNTLTVTAIVSGQPLVDAGGFVTGPGVPAGTYITAYGQHNAIGTFTLAGPGINSGTKVASTKMTFQRTSLYKFGLSTDTNTTMYFNNMGFTTN